MRVQIKTTWPDNMNMSYDQEVLRDFPDIWAATRYMVNTYIVGKAEKSLPFVLGEIYFRAFSNAITHEGKQIGFLSRAFRWNWSAKWYKDHWKVDFEGKLFPRKVRRNLIEQWDQADPIDPLSIERVRLWTFLEGDRYLALDDEDTQYLVKYTRSIEHYPEDEKYIIKRVVRPLDSHTLYGRKRRRRR
jgi:hypothetical protein